MILIQKLQDVTDLGYSVTISRNMSSLYIVVSTGIREKISTKDFDKHSWLPTQDFNEQKIADCIDRSISEIDENIRKYFIEKGKDSFK